MLVWPLASRLRAQRILPRPIRCRMRAVVRVPVLPICRSGRLPRLDSRWQETLRSQGMYSAAIELAADLLGQDVPFDLQRRGAGEVLRPEHVTADALVRQQALIAKLDFSAHRAICVLARIRMHDEHKLFSPHGAL